MALSLVLMSILQPKDEVIYISPAYTSYLPQILLSESNVVVKKLCLDSYNYQINYNKLKKLINSKTKSNPYKLSSQSDWANIKYQSS